MGQQYTSVITWKTEGDRLEQKTQWLVVNGVKVESNVIVI
jgi:hypothetical protein